MQVSPRNLSRTSLASVETALQFLNTQYQMLNRHSFTISTTRVKRIARNEQIVRNAVLSIIIQYPKTVSQSRFSADGCFVTHRQRSSERGSSQARGNSSARRQRSNVLRSAGSRRLPCVRNISAAWKYPSSSEGKGGCTPNFFDIRVSWRTWRCAAHLSQQVRHEEWTLCSVATFSRVRCPASCHICFTFFSSCLSRAQMRALVGIHHIGLAEHHPVHHGKVLLHGGASGKHELGVCQANGKDSPHAGEHTAVLV